MAETDPKPEPTQDDPRDQDVRAGRRELTRAQALAKTGSWRLDIRTGELVWSEENWRIFGVPEGTPLTYEVFLDTVHPEDREFVHERWTAAMSGAPYDIEHRIVVGDTVKWVRERAELDFDETGTLCRGFGTTQDITDLKLAEKAIRDAQMRTQWLARFPHENPNPVLRVNAADRAIIYCNPAARVAPGWDSRVGAALPDEVDALVERAVGDSASFEEDIELAGLVYAVAVAVVANEDYVNLYVRDVTARRHAEEAVRRLNAELERRVDERTAQLRDSERRFRSIFENAGDAIIIADPATRDVILANPSASAMLGYGPDEMSALTVPDLHPKDSLVETMEVFEQIAAGAVSQASNIALKCKDGSVRYADVTASLVPIGGQLLVAGTFHDVTERRQAEESVRFQRELLRRLALRLTSVQREERMRIAAGLHDDVGQLLAALMLRMKEGLTAEDDRRESLLNESVDILRQAIHHVREATFELGSAVLYQVGLGAALENLAARMTDRFGVPVSVEIDPTAEPVPEAYRAHLYGSARELLFNVFKHAGASRAVVRLQRCDDTVAVSVEDDGKGFTPASEGGGMAHEDAFGLFHISQEAQALGGSVSLESEPDGGTRVTISIPLD